MLGLKLTHVSKRGPFFKITHQMPNLQEKRKNVYIARCIIQKTWEKYLTQLHAWLDHSAWILSLRIQVSMGIRYSHIVETPSVEDFGGICCTEGPSIISIQYAEMWLAVSGGKPLFTVGLPMFALTKEYYLSLPWGLLPTVFYWCQNIAEKHKHNILKQSRKFINWMWFVGQMLIKLETFSFEVFISYHFDVLFGSYLSKHAGGHSMTTEACTSLTGGHWVPTEVCTSLARVCVVWRSGSSLELSTLCLRKT